MLGAGVARALCAGPDGGFVVATGGIGQSRVLVWSRPPNGTWSAEPELLTARGSGLRCADGRGGPVVVGIDDNGAAVSWRRARRGMPWIKSVIGVSSPATAVNDVIVDGSGYLATGTSGARGQSDLAVWRSADGAGWTRVGGSEPVFLEAGFQSGEGMAKARGRLVVVGRHGAGNAGIWIGTP
jgi:hypothetical protein